jgi:hypothetical protein
MTADPTSKLLARQKSTLGAFLSIAAAIFIAGVVLGYARGTMVHKVPKSNQKEKVASSKVPKNEKQRKRPTHDEKVAALELPPEPFDEEAPRTTAEFQKKLVPDKKRPMQTDNVLIHQDFREEAVSDPAATEKIDLQFAQEKKGENATELKNRPNGCSGIQKGKEDE